MIRKAKKQDSNQIIQINIDSWKETYKNIFDEKLLNNLDNKKEESIEKCKNKINEYIVYEINNKVVGFLKYGKNKKNYSDEYAEIYALYVDKNYQKQGIGTKLINYSLKLLKKDYKYILVSTLIKNKANEFYKKQGFKQISTTSFKLENKSYKENLYIKQIKE